MTGKPWWSLRGKERVAEKAKYEAQHPLPSRSGHFVSKSGHVHYYGGSATRRVAQIAAAADVPPIPDFLNPFDDGSQQLVWIGERGVYSIDMSSVDAFRSCLERAIEGESPAANTQLPGQSEEVVP